MEDQAREIKFRGKTRVGGKWVYGSFLPPCNIVWESFDPYFEDNAVNDEEIILETRGQYTGLCDRNGKPIYEGDIIHIVFEDDGEGNVEEDYLAVIYSSRNLAFMLSSRVDDTGFTARITSFDWIILNCEVAGNVHDNRELL